MSPPRPHGASANEQLTLDSHERPAPRPRRPPPRASDQPLRLAAVVERDPTEAAKHVDLSQPLVDADCIAALLCVKRKRIYELARRPDDPLPSVRIGRAVRFVRAQVEAWVADQAPR